MQAAFHLVNEKHLFTLYQIKNKRNAQFLELHIFQVNTVDARTEIAEQFGKSFLQFFVGDGLQHTALLVRGIGEQYLQGVNKPVLDGVEVVDVGNVVAQITGNDLVEEELAGWCGLGKEGEELLLLFTGIELQEVRQVVVAVLSGTLKDGVLRLASEDIEPLTGNLLSVVAETIFIVFTVAKDTKYKSRILFFVFGVEAERVVLYGRFCRCAHDDKAFGQIEGGDEIALAHSIGTEHGRCFQDGVAFDRLRSRENRRTKQEQSQARLGYALQGGGNAKRNLRRVETVTVTRIDTVYIGKDSLSVENKKIGLSTSADGGSKKSGFLTYVKWIFALICAIVVLIITMKVCSLRR